MTGRHSATGRILFRPLVLFLLCLLTGCRLFKASSNTMFLGDSLTEGWSYPQANLGIFGNTTARMAARFPGQIAGHRYQWVVILGGTNDVLLGIDPAVTIQNLEKIGNYAIEAGAQPVICEIPPIFHNYNLADKTDYSTRVHVLNDKIAQLSAQHRWGLVDYYHPLLGHPTYSSDGVHLNRRGYAVMEWTFLRKAPSP